MDAQHEYDGPTINGRPVATVEMLARWCAEAKIEYNGCSDDGMIEIARALNHALLMGPCWNKKFEPIRRRGPHWAPKATRERGRPKRLDKNLAVNLGRIAIENFPGARKKNVNHFIELMMNWLGAED